MGGGGTPNDLVSSGRSVRETFRPRSDDKSARSLFMDAKSCCSCLKLLAENGDSVGGGLVGLLVVVVVVVAAWVDVAIAALGVTGRSGISLANFLCKSN